MNKGIKKRLSEVSEDDLQKSIEALVTLRGYYQGKERYNWECPLCKATEDNCSICPWPVITDAYCNSNLTKVHAYAAYLRYPTEYPDFVNNRIKEITLWLRYYRAELRRR